MNQGAKRHKLADRGEDLYETPDCATRTLLGVEMLPERIWEPCAGRGAISRILTARGHDVLAQDLVAYPGADADIVAPVDFMCARAAPFPDAYIVTNPPFKIADAFIRHGLSLGCPMIVLLRLMAIEGANRSDLVDRHLIRIWAGKERLPRMHREGWAGNYSNSGAPFAWFVFSPRAADRVIELRRVSWRKEVMPDAVRSVHSTQPVDGEAPGRFRGRSWLHWP